MANILTSMTTALDNHAARRARLAAETRPIPKTDLKRIIAPQLVALRLNNKLQ
jgi:hypothetical protein